MMQPEKVLRIGVVVFKVLAWLSLATQVAMGLYLLIQGGEPILIGDFDVPARLVGVLNFLSAAIYFFSFWLTSCLLHVLLDIRSRLVSRP